MKLQPQPDQPVYRDEHGTVRFRENSIVHYLLREGGIDLNRLAAIPFPQADRVQFAQLIGYSVSGLSELDYVDDDSYERSVEAHNRLVRSERRRAARKR